MMNYSIAIRSTKPGLKKANITETKAYAVAQASGSIDMDEFAGHIAEHGSKYKRGDIYAILAEAVDCMREKLLEGQIVTLGELGSFRCSYNCEGSASASTLSADNIKAVKVIWTPGKHFRDLREKADFQCVPNREAQALAVAEARAQETLQSDDENELG
ncbi:MAG: DNA-binding protein [Bacteroidaceae bacterium]|nr:DNA-binding protein [Bacteroidaceae bacterium]